MTSVLLVGLPARTAALPRGCSCARAVLSAPRAAAPGTAAEAAPGTAAEAAPGTAAEAAPGTAAEAAPGSESAVAPELVSAGGPGPDVAHESAALSLPSGVRDLADEEG
jgi:hypothetical protein